MARPLSFRFRILALVLGTAIVPLGLMGVLLLKGAARSGERLLAARLDQATADTRDVVVQRWVSVRSGLLNVAEWPDVRSFGAGGTPGRLVEALVDLDPRVREVEIRRAADGSVFTFDRSALRPEAGGLPPPTRPLMRAAFDVRSAPMRSDVSARIDFGLEGEYLLPRDALPASSAGMVATLIDPSNGASLLPIPLDVSVLESGRFESGGETWLAVRRSFSDPPLELVLAAPLAPYVDPFRRSARRSALLLAVVAAGAFLAAVVLTSRMTRSLRTVVQGADAVTAGDLGHRVDYAGQDEIGRVAEAFNTMTESLQRTLREMASRESLAAVGEFAASLAHEVRNPLTAVKIDLQAVEEKMPERPELREPLRRALDELDRLDATVGDTLSIVRRGADVRVLEIGEPIEAAAHGARPAFESRQASLDVVPGAPDLRVHGDPAALERLFLNLLLNAAEALRPGGRAGIRVDPEGDLVRVRIDDDGPGIPDGLRERVLEPLFSTKTTGTGLGLTIARRIVVAHGGEMEIGSSPMGGARVEIRLPAARSRARGTDSAPTEPSGSRSL